MPETNNYYGPAKIVELGEFDSYWIDNGSKTFKRNFQDIKLWTSKTSSRITVNPPIPIIHEEIIEESSVPNSPTKREVISPHSIQVNPPEKESPFKKQVAPLPTRSTITIPKKTSASETFRAIGLPDIEYEKKLKRLADKRDKK